MRLLLFKKKERRERRKEKKGKRKGKKEERNRFLRGHLSCDDSYSLGLVWCARRFRKEERREKRWVILADLTMGYSSMTSYRYLGNPSPPQKPSILPNVT